MDAGSGDRSETPVRRRQGAVRMWVALLDAAESAMSVGSPHDPTAQRTASKRFDALFLYEHQMTPRARRRAREYVWRRDHPGQQLPAEALHAVGTRTPEPCCVCPTCRARWWAQCLCRSCHLARLLGNDRSQQPAPGTRAELSDQSTSGRSAPRQLCQTYH
jgi:hypothetical protein